MKARQILERTIRRLRLLVRQSGSVDVVIYGKYPRAWRAALNAGSPVWTRLPDVHSVTVVPAGRRLPRPGKRRQVVIPLLERNILALKLPAIVMHPGDAIEPFADKARFADYAVAQGFEAYVPWTVTDPGGAKFPAVLKRTNLASGRGVVVVESRAELDRRLAEAPWAGESVIVQELIEGTSEYVTHMVCRDGKLLWHLSYRYPRPSARDIKTGAQPGWTQPYRPSAEILDILAGFARPVRFTGPLNIAYKFRADGRPAVFEINPRLGASLMLPENTDDLRACLAVILANATWTEPVAQ